VLYGDVVVGLFIAC